MKIASSIALLASLAATTASAFTPAATTTTSSVALSVTRRESIEQLASALSAGILLTATAASQPANAVSAEEAEYNELINVLKERSETNSEANKNYAMRSDKLSQRDFDDVKTRRPKLIIVSTTKGNKICIDERRVYYLQG